MAKTDQDGLKCAPFLPCCFQPGCSTRECTLCTLTIYAGVTTRQPLLGALLGLFCPSHIDFSSVLCRLGQDGYTVGQNFSETPRNCKGVRLSIIPIADLSNSQLRNQGRVTWQYSQVSVLPGNLHFFSIATNQQPARSNDFKFERV